MTRRPMARRAIGRAGPCAPFDRLSLGSPSPFPAEPCSSGLLRAPPGGGSPPAGPRTPERAAVKLDRPSLTFVEPCGSAMGDGTGLASPGGAAAGASALAAGPEAVPVPGTGSGDRGALSLARTVAGTTACAPSDVAPLEPGWGGFRAAWAAAMNSRQVL